MKVLMFGWEFPPHISGGLGTACFGLTESLVKSDTQILFVIPKADAHTIEDQFEIINASNIYIPVPSREGNQPASTRQPPKKVGTKMLTKVITMSIRSCLIPYTSPDVLLGSASISQWNYELPVSEIVRKAKRVGTRYQFYGGYGPTLMEEVDKFAVTAAEIARQRKFDIIHAHDWLTYAAGIAAKKISGKPLVVHVHATEFDRSGKNVNPDIFKIEREGMVAADRIIAVSQWTKNIIITKYQIPSNKVVVVHNGILSREKSKDIQRPPIGKRLIAFVGRITYQKGPDYFVDAAAMVLQKIPDVHFVMVGSGDLLAKMIERVSRLRISSHFHFTGFLKSDQVDRIWSVSTVYVMPSISEPFGLTPLEAAQEGVPVIISNQSGVAEVMQHVIKVDFWNIEALADAMCNLLKYQSLTNELKKKSKEEITKITWALAAKKLNKIYHELTE